MKLNKKVSSLPTDPGVYLLLSKGEVIYVGKASSLRKRVRSYLGTPKNNSVKTRALMAKIDDVDYIITDTELEALLLEEDLIKEYRPRFNIQLKDNKRYPYVKITKERFPRMEITRKREEEDAYYYGPYTNVGALRETLKTIEEFFPIINCTWDPDEGFRRPCLRYYIDSCQGPCAKKVSEEEYNETVKRVKGFLKGDRSELMKDLEHRMEQASAEQKYEQAAKWRNKLRAVQKIVGKQKVRITDERDQDFIAVAEDEADGIIQIFFTRNGKITGQDYYHVRIPEHENSVKAISAFLRRFYQDRKVIPEVIHVPELPKDKETIEGWLSSRRGRGVEISVPKKGQKAQVLQMAENNAKFELRKKDQPGQEQSKQALSQLQDNLNLDLPPKRIEGYDISNISGSDAVGSMVVFVGGQPIKSEYRRFKINRQHSPDDYGMIAEVLERRVRHGLKEIEEGSSSGKFSSLPDLMLIDGGKGQLNAAKQAAVENGLDYVPMVAIAKAEEVVYGGEDESPLPIEKDSEAHYLLRKIRNEAHRFAIDYHKRLRQKRTIRSSLDTIKGIGPKRKRKLLNTFNSTKGVREASLEELKNISGLPTKVAKRVYNFFETEK